MRYLYLVWIASSMETSGETSVCPVRKMDSIAEVKSNSYL